MAKLSIFLMAVITVSCLKKSDQSEQKSFGSKTTKIIDQVAKDPNDPFRPYGEAAVMKSGSDKGKAIDIDWRRSVRLVSTVQAKEYFADFDPNRDYVIANVKEHQHFYVARFKKDSLAKAILNKEQLFAKLSVHHTTLRFELKEGEVFELVPQKKGSSEAPKTYKSLSFGVFALGAPGKFFGPLNSIKGDLVSAYLFFTPPHQSFRARELPVNYDMDEIDFDLISQPNDLFKLFEYIAKEGDRLGYDEIYGMFLNNCVHRLLALIRGALPEYRNDGVIDKVLTAAYNTDKVPTGAANGFSSLIQKEFKRAGAISDKANWRQFWDVPILVEFLDHIDCDKFNDEFKVRNKCAEIYSKTPLIMPDRIKQQQSYLVDKCISTNKFRCLER